MRAHEQAYSQWGRGTQVRTTKGQDRQRDTGESHEGEQKEGKTKKPPQKTQDNLKSFFKLRMIFSQILRNFVLYNIMLVTWNATPYVTFFDV